MAVKNNTSRQAELVDQHLPLIRHIALGLSRSLPPSFPVEDLIQEGVIGLLRAATQYNPSRGVPFACFSRKRIRGAMLESVRRPVAGIGGHSGVNWLAGTCLPFGTAEEGVGVPEPACAPTQASQAHRHILLDQVTRAATWLTADQRSIISMRYGSDEMAMPAIAEALGISLRYVYCKHDDAIAELQFRTGARNSAARRLVVVPKPQPKVIAVSTAIDIKQRAEVDETGALHKLLDPQLAALKPQIDRMKLLDALIRSRFDNSAGDRGFEASGNRFVSQVGPKAYERAIDYPGLIKSIGVKVYAAFARTTLKALEENVSAAVVAEVVSSDYTGSRTITTAERGTPAAAPAKKAA